MWGSAALSLIPAGVFCLFIASGEMSMVARNWLLIPAGALIGACLFVYAGYVASDWRGAKAAETHKPIKEAGVPSNNMESVTNNQGINTQGQIGNNTVINNTAGPSHSGVLSPKDAVLFTPKNSERSALPLLQWGTSDVLFDIDSFRQGPGAKLLPALDEQQFKIESINGKLMVSINIADENGKLIVELIRNEWKVLPPPGTWDRNYTEDALEVRDAAGAVVLQVRAFPNRIQLQGMWWVDTGFNGIVRYIVRGNQRDGGQLILVPKANKDPLPVIDRMFKYPSDRHLGELAG
jgi:hypothetical protein